MTTKPRPDPSRRRIARLPVCRPWAHPRSALCRWQTLTLAVTAALALQASLSEASQAVVQLTTGFAGPEILTINQGDTVVFVWSDGLYGFAQSYNGGWKSPVMTVGQTFAHTFNEPGRDVYRVGRPTGPFFPGIINVQAVTGSPPAIWIARPLNNFIVPGHTQVEAATTNSPDSVKVVNFYADGQLVGSATNPPYVVTLPFAFVIPVAYNLTASLVDANGNTSTSAPVRVIFANGDARIFQPWRLPQGQTVLFISGIPPWCCSWSADLSTWNFRNYAQLLGNSVIIDEATTNEIQRFYKVQFCPLGAFEPGWPYEFNALGPPHISRPSPTAAP